MFTPKNELSEAEKKAKKDLFVSSFMQSFFSHPDAPKALSSLSQPGAINNFLSEISPPTAKATLTQEVINAVSNYKTVAEQQCIKAWLKKHNIDEVDNQGRSLLHHAVRNGITSLVAFFIDRKKANIHLDDATGMTPLIWAASELSDCTCEEGIVKIQDCIRLLHEKGAAFQSTRRSIFPQYAMQLACLHGDLKTVQLLVELGDDISQDIMGKTPIEWARMSKIDQASDVESYLNELSSLKP